jgi:hypothetical protein
MSLFLKYYFFITLSVGKLVARYSLFFLINYSEKSTKSSSSSFALGMRSAAAVFQRELKGREIGRVKKQLVVFFRCTKDPRN